ncbi:MAG: uroporphyrinogen decarboxylase family protein [Alistipes sp.]|uniref:uroporphyrinogen decarboxylase family protein n=1 Tax=Alistipes sp. TaxID=1872444 RepID=UPI0025BB44B2|nr:uroporphyrinogen decarboxylase family protein [Alistipes sp.]MCD8273570.1 uroporphyrinogen decarboxylase family protein [Alistipes sp.]
MNTTAWIKSLIESGRLAAMPIMTHPGIELLGRRVLDAVTDGRVHFEAIEALNERFPQSAGCTVIMDLTVEAEAFGASLHFADDEVPSVVGRLVSNLDEVKALEVPSLDAARVPEYLRANRLAAERIDKPVFAGCIGPYSLAGRLFDMTEIMMGIYTEPETVNLLLEKCTEFIRNYCLALRECGVAGVIMAEPAAGLLPNEECMQYSSVYVKRIVEAVQDDSFAVILHNCGNTGHCTQAMVATGAKAYHFGNKIDMLDALRECPADVLVMGNLDPVEIFRNATPQQTASATRDLLNRAAGYPNFVISSGCDTPPQVPFENIEAFYKTVEEFNSAK